MVSCKDFQKSPLYMMHPEFSFKCLHFSQKLSLGKVRHQSGVLRYENLENIETKCKNLTLSNLPPNQQRNFFDTSTEPIQKKQLH